LVNMRARSSNPCEIDRQQREDRAEMNQHRDESQKAFFSGSGAEEVIDQAAMAGRGHGEKFGQASTTPL